VQALGPQVLGLVMVPETESSKAVNTEEAELFAYVRVREGGGDIIVVSHAGSRTVTITENVFSGKGTILQVMSTL